MSILKIKEYQDVNLNTPKEALNYLIYLTEDSFRLVELSLLCGIEKISLKAFFNEFYLNEHKQAYLIHLGHEFYSSFTNQNNSFIFEAYFFDNPKSTDIEKIAKINRLIANINNTLNEIKEATNKDDLIKPNWEKGDELIKTFKNEFSSYIIINGEKYLQYPYKLLLYFFGIYLNEMLVKINTNFIGFIKSTNNTKNITHHKSINPHPNIFKTNDIYTHFLNYTNKHIIEPYRDYSYLFQRLKKEELIHDMKHKKFISWLLSKNLITEKNYHDFIDHNGFRSYSKSYHVERENNFNNIFMK